MESAGFKFKILKDGSNGVLDFEATVAQVSRLTQKEVKVLDPKEHIVLVVGGSFATDIGNIALGGISIELV